MMRGMVRSARKAWRRYRYNAYINSDRWRRKRARILKRDGYKCRRCPETQSLECHHLTYDRFGHERDDDLITLCHQCHKQADRERRQQARRKAWATRSI